MHEAILELLTTVWSMVGAWWGALVEHVTAFLKNTVFSNKDLLEMLVSKKDFLENFGKCERERERFPECLEDEQRKAETRWSPLFPPGR